MDYSATLYPNYFLFDMDKSIEANKNQVQRERARRRGQQTQSVISSDFDSVEPQFGISDTQRGIPTLKWDNAVSREMFKFSRGNLNSSKNENDALDVINSNYRVTISPMRTNNRQGIVSIVSADTHLQLNSISSTNGQRPITGGESLSYHSSNDSRMDPRSLLASKKRLPPDKKAQLNNTKNEIRDATTENWLKKRNRFPEFRWTVKQKRALRKWFDQLDDDKSGEVDVDELADPLLSTGIAKTMIEVVDLIREVDRNNSGEIGFEEFLQIMKPSETKIKKSGKNNGKEKGNGKGKEKTRKEGEENPIKQLEKIQHENGDIDMKVVVAMQRRKFLLDAIVGELSRREKVLNNIGELEAEKKHSKGKCKLILAVEIRDLKKAIDKSYSAKQNFISSMKTMVDRNKTMVDNKYEFDKNENGTSLSLTEAIDQFSEKFDLMKLKSNQLARIKLKQKMERGELIDDRQQQHQQQKNDFKLPTIKGKDGKMVLRALVSREGNKFFTDEHDSTKQTNPRGMNGREQSSSNCDSWYAGSGLKAGPDKEEFRRRTNVLRHRQVMNLRAKRELGGGKRKHKRGQKPGRLS